MEEKVIYSPGICVHCGSDKIIYSDPILEDILTNVRSATRKEKRFMISYSHIINHKKRGNNSPLLIFGAMSTNKCSERSV